LSVKICTAKKKHVLSGQKRLQMRHSFWKRTALSSWGFGHRLLPFLVEPVFLAELAGSNLDGALIQRKRFRVL